MSNYNSPMNLAAKASAEAGYAMAALLVGMAVMAVMLSVAMPTWSQMIRREKEEELIFRGNQYARAFAQYQSKFANAAPANLDVLVEQRMLRRKFKDPLSPNKDGEFALLYMSNQPQGAAGGGFGTAGRGGTVPGRGSTGAPGTGSTSAQSRSGTAGATTGESSGATYTTQAAGPIMGVASKNTGASIKVYNGKKKYNEWYFVAREGGAGGAGGAGGPAGGIGGRGGPPGGRGGGNPPFGGPTGRGGGSGSTGRGSSGGFGGRGAGGVGAPGGGGGSMPSPPR